MDEIAEVIFVFAPTVVPWTVMLNVQEPFGASAAPERLTVPDPATAVIVPPSGGAGPSGRAAPGSAITVVNRMEQPPVRPFGVATIKPAGSVSENPIALRRVAEFGLWTVKLS